MVSASFDFLDKKITVNGLGDDHIFKIISGGKCFYEQELLNLIGILPVKEGIFLDIGANIGNHTLFFAKILGKDVVSVEPNPITMQFLVDNIASNYLDNNVTVYDKPIGESLDDLYDSICVSDVNLGMHKFTKTTSENSKITGETIDNIAQNKKVSLIKIDVEGAELSALKGAKDTLERHKPVLIIEAGSMLEKNKIIGYVSSLGYHLMTIKCATDTLVFVHQDDNVSIYRSVVDAYDNLNFQQSMNKTFKSMNRGNHANHSEVMSALQALNLNNSSVEQNGNHKNQINALQQEVLFYQKKSDILETKVEFLFNRIKKANPIVALFCESFQQYKKKLNQKLNVSVLENKKKN